MMSGPTPCGKTYFLSKLLQRDDMRPALQRIIRLCKRWQPLYCAIKKTVILRVEFIKVMPLNLEKDYVLDPRENNALVLDDMVREAVRDRGSRICFRKARITDILNQNLYFSKDPTHRRICQYRELFNNPIDKQKVMTLARHMYPSASRIL